MTGEYAVNGRDAVLSTNVMTNARYTYVSIHIWFHSHVYEIEFVRTMTMRKLSVPSERATRSLGRGRRDYDALSSESSKTHLLLLEE
jgi:hypothetical protein